MASSPYRAPVERGAPPREPPSLEMPILAGFLLVVTALYVLVSIASGEPARIEVVLGWVVVLLMVVAMGAARRPRRER